MTHVAAYGKTPLGQLLYDLAYTNLSNSYLARKHRQPVASIRRMRASKAIQDLRAQIAQDRKEDEVNARRA